MAPLVRPHPVIKGISLSAYSFRGEMRYERGKERGGKMEMPAFLDYCGKIGLDGAELTAYFFKTPVERAEINQLKRQAHLLGLDLTSGAIGNNFSPAPGSEQARAQLDYTRDWIDHYADLGVPVIRVFAGGPGRGISVDQAIANIVENLGVALEHAEKRGVLLALENHDFASDVDRLMQIVRQVDSPWFGLMLDSGNLSKTPDPYGELARIAPYALMAQVKVAIPVDGKKQPTDFKRLVGVLREAGYGGYLVLEYEESEDPYVAVPRYIAQLRQAIAV